MMYRKQTHFVDITGVGRVEVHYDQWCAQGKGDRHTPHTHNSDEGYRFYCNGDKNPYKPKHESGSHYEWQDVPDRPAPITDNRLIWLRNAKDPETGDFLKVQRRVWVEGGEHKGRHRGQYEGN